MKNLLQLLFVISFGSLALLCQGQVTIERQVMANSGGFDTSGKLSLSWTLGETITETVSGGTLVLTQGFQQPKPEEISPNNVREIPLDELGVKVFPNPASMEVFIQVTNHEELPLSLQLFALNGKLLSARKVTDSNTVLDVGDFPDGVYILRFITEDNRPVAPIKLQKIGSQ